MHEMDLSYIGDDIVLQCNVCERRIVCYDDDDSMIVVRPGDNDTPHWASEGMEMVIGWTEN